MTIHQGGEEAHWSGVRKEKRRRNLNVVGAGVPARLHEERVIAVRDEPKLRPEFCQQDATDGIRSPWISCSRGVEEFSGGSQSAQKIKNTVQPVFREEPNLRLEFYLRDVTVAVTLETSCSRGVEVSKSFLEVVKVARKRVNVVQRVIRLGFDSAMKDADRDAWWLAFLNEVWQPEAHAPIVWCHKARLRQG